MKSIIHIIMIILTLCSYGCKSDKDEFKITDVQFKNNIFKPLCIFRRIPVQHFR